MYKLAFPFLICSVILFSCGKEDLNEYDMNFNGVWRNRDTLHGASNEIVDCYMHIGGNSDTIEMLCDEFGTCWQVGYGGAQINKDRNAILISSPGGERKREFNINRFPYQHTDGRWYCAIENVMMIRD